MKKIAVIGLGYVGLPLAVEFGKKREVVGFDINKRRIQELTDGHDRTLEASSDELQEATYLSYTSEPSDLSNVDIYIIIRVNYHEIF
jgi:UDP-N-acetyl-D-galactosamine dehydrogenase